MADDKDFDFEKMFKMPEAPTSHLARVHPHFGTYPEYLKQALVANERMQGRMPKHA